VWHHLVVAQTGTTVALYLDGSLVASKTGTANTVTAAISYLAVYAASNNPLDGSLDDVRIYSRALSADDVAALYAWTGFSPWWAIQNSSQARIT